MISGHSSLIGVNKGKVVEFDVRSKNCSVCSYYQGRNETTPQHECNANWTGTRKVSYGLEKQITIQVGILLAPKIVEILWH